MRPACETSVDNVPDITPSVSSCLFTYICPSILHVQLNSGDLPAAPLVPTASSRPDHLLFSLPHLVNLYIFLHHLYSSPSLWIPLPSGVDPTSQLTMYAVQERDVP
jgi:hypothetical protein